MTKLQTFPAPALLRYPVTTALLLLMPVLATASGAHTHGHARLQIAIDGADVHLIFTSPTANLVGFEHEPENDRQRELINQAARWFRATALVNLEDGSCDITQAEVLTGFDDTGHHSHHEHAPADSHSDFEVSQRLRCDRVAGATPELMITPLPQQFPEIEHLTVDWVTDEGQGRSPLYDDDHTIRLDR